MTAISPEAKARRRERDRRKAEQRRVGHLTWTRVCEVCGETFEQRRIGRPRLYCSPKCEAVGHEQGRSAS